MKKLNISELIEKIFDKRNIIFFLLLVFFIIDLLLFFHFFLGYDWLPESGFDKYFVSKLDHEQNILEIEQYQRTVWDWLDLFIIPVVLIVLAGILSSNDQKRKERIDEINHEEELFLENDRQSAQILKSFTTQISDYILNKELLTASKESPIVTVARSLTFSTLRSLGSPNKRDDKRQGLLILFLYESGLISGEYPIISLNSVDLLDAKFDDFNLEKINLSKTFLGQASFTQANLKNSYLPDCNLKGAVFTKANLDTCILDSSNLFASKFNGCDASNARFVDVTLSLSDLSNAIFLKSNFTNAVLNRCDFSYSDLSGSILDNADLSEANLLGATVENEQLSKAKSLKGIVYPDGTIHREG